MSCGMGLRRVESLLFAVLAGSTWIAYHYSTKSAHHSDQYSRGRIAHDDGAW